MIAGLTFAAMITGYLLIGGLLALHNGYYRVEFHNDIDLLLRMASYVFLFALTITSFFPVRRKMRPEQWR
jgi:DMSO/TMAO reductase YedYZ heme-binding membrane subunit